MVHASWRSPTDLPARGPLFGGLADLAHHMQRRRFDGEASQVRLDNDDAVEVLPETVGEDIVDAAISLSIMDEDTVTDAVAFVQQLVQEYMTAQLFADDPEAAMRLVAVPWRSDEVDPSLDSVKAMIAVADPLPALPATGWEETTVMAAAMSTDPDGFVGRLQTVNLVVAARCAAQTETHVSGALLQELRASLLERSCDEGADLRARIDAAVALGELGDPRFSPRASGDAPHVAPRTVPIAAGTYRLGRSDIESEDESPEHGIELGAFGLAVHPVTNAEYRLFVMAGGYDDERHTLWRRRLAVDDGSPRDGPGRSVLAARSNRRAPRPL